MGVGVVSYDAHCLDVSLCAEGRAHGVLLWNSNGMEVAITKERLQYRVIGGLLDFFFLMGPTPADVMQQMTSIVGRPAMPPYWALGFMNSKCDHPLRRMGSPPTHTHIHAHTHRHTRTHACTHTHTHTHTDTHLHTLSPLLPHPLPPLCLGFLTNSATPQSPLLLAPCLATHVSFLCLGLMHSKCAHIRRFISLAMWTPAGVYDSNLLLMGPTPADVMQQ